MAPIQAVIFDFDDTLADTLSGRLGALRAAALQVLKVDLTEESLTAVHSRSNLESQMAVLAGGRASVAEQLVEAYRQLYYDPESEPPSLFAGVDSVLSRLRTNGVRLALVTSRHRVGADGNPNRGVLWELKRMGRADLFEVVDWVRGFGRSQAGSRSFFGLPVEAEANW